MRQFEKRLRALEAAAGMTEKRLLMETWIVTPGSSEVWLYSSGIAGRPETKRIYEEGKRTGRLVGGKIVETERS